MTPRHVVIVTLGRQGGLGGRRRLESLEAIFRAGGARTTRIELLRAHRAAIVPERWPEPLAVLRGRAVPESVVWSPRSLARQLERLRPDTVVAVTARAFHPVLLDAAPHVVLDLVDRMSANYQLRAQLSGRRSRALAFRGLAWASGRFEGRSWADVRRLAAGRADAIGLGAEWVPNVVAAGATVDPGTADHDLLFFGSLGYAPNVEALARLGRIWPLLQARRPGTTAIVAGADPGAAVVGLAARHGWTLEPWFDTVAGICGRARVAVIPMDHATGIQNKVLDAAAVGLPQVVTPTVLAGVDEHFPARSARDDVGFVTAVVGLLEDPGAAAALGAQARAHVIEHYSADAWAAPLARARAVT